MNANELLLIQVSFIVLGAFALIIGFFAEKRIVLRMIGDYRAELLHKNAIELMDQQDYDAAMVLVSEKEPGIRRLTRGESFWSEFALLLCKRDQYELAVRIITNCEYEIYVRSIAKIRKLLQENGQERLAQQCAWAENRPLH